MLPTGYGNRELQKDKNVYGAKYMDRVHAQCLLYNASLNYFIVIGEH